MLILKKISRRQKSMKNYPECNELKQNVHLNFATPEWNGNKEICWCIFQSYIVGAVCIYSSDTCASESHSEKICFQDFQLVVTSKFCIYSQNCA